MSSSIISTANLISHQETIYLGIPIFIVGVIGGFVNVIVFLSLKTFRQSSCAFYLTIVSMVNIGYLFTGLLTFIMMYEFSIDWTKQSRFYCIFREGFVHICMLISFTCLCLATIDQFLATCSSPRWQQLCNIKLARHLCLVFILLWFLYGISFFTSYDLIIIPSTENLDCMVINDIFQQYFKTFHVLILLAVLPISITVLFGCLAYRNIQQLSYRTLPLIRRELDKQLTIMVLMQVVFNFFAITPYIIINAIILDSNTMKEPVGNSIMSCARILSIIFLYSCFAMISLSTFEILPDEIILHICQYLRGADVLYSFYNLNNRLNITITGYCRYVNLMAVPYKHFKYAVTHVLPCIGYHVQSFVLNAYWETITSTQLYAVLFTSRLSFMCPQLQTLTLQSFTSEKLLLFVDILKNFSQLNTLNIRRLNGDTTDVLLPKLFLANDCRLAVVSFDLDSIYLGLSEDSTVTLHSNIQELTVNLSLVQALPRLFKLVPNVRRLCVYIYECTDDAESEERFTNLSPLVHLTDFYLCSNDCFWTFEEMTSLLQLMPSLQKLTFNLSTFDKRFFDEKELFMILPSSSTQINLFICYYFSESNCEVGTSQPVRFSIACLFDENRHRVIVHTIPCNLCYMILPASIGKQMSSGSKYTQQVENLFISNATSSLEILLTVQHFRRLRKLDITIVPRSEIPPVPSSIQPIVLWLPLLKTIGIRGSCDLFHILNASPNLEQLTIDFDCLKAPLDDKPTCHLLKTRIVRLDIIDWIDIESNLLQRIAEVFGCLRNLVITMKDTKLLIDSFVLTIISLWKSRLGVSLGVKGLLSEEINKNLRQWIIDHFFHFMPEDSFAVEYKDHWFSLWL